MESILPSVPPLTFSNVTKYGKHLISIHDFYSKMLNEATTVEDTVFFLSLGAEPDREYSGETPLTAVSTVDKMKILLKRGADPNLPTSEGVYPLSRADTSEKIQLLIEHGANLNPAILIHCSSEMLEEILNLGVDLKEDLPDGSNIAHYINLFDCSKIRLLVKHGMDVNYTRKGLSLLGSLLRELDSFSSRRGSCIQTACFDCGICYCYGDEIGTISEKVYLLMDLGADRSKLGEEEMEIFSRSFHYEDESSVEEI